MLSNLSSFKSLQTTHLDKNVSPSQNNYKYQHAHTSSTISNQNICIISDQYSKAKLLQLQEEISKLRKQMSQKQSFYHKQKGGLLNKLQILSSQNIQIKQRQSNLIKLNQTLQLAISTTNNSQSLTLTTKKLDQLRDQLNDKSRMLKQSKRSIQEYKKLIRVVQQQKYHIIQQKQKIIYQLNSKCKHMRLEKEQMISVLKNDIVNLPFKKEMINMIIQSLSCFNHQKHEFGPQDGSLYQNNNSQYLESPICKRRLPVELKGFKQSKFIDQSYSRFSGNSIINQLNKQQIASVYSQQNQQSQKLLCEVCKKVFQQQQFIIHMNQCNQIYQLHRKRSQLQKAIDELNMQQRKSLSQKKQVMAQRSNPLEQWDQNTDIDISRSKITSKNTNFNNRSILQVNQRKKVANRSQLFNNYTSNRLY